MTEQTGTPERKKVPIIPIAGGEAHLQNEIVSYKCYICGAEEHEDMALLRTDDKKMGFACFDHHGVVQEFIKQYKRIPLGWEQTIIGDTDAQTSSQKGSRPDCTV